MKGKRIKVIAPLEKFDCKRQNVGLSENLRIRAVLDKERKRIWEIGRMLRTPVFLHGAIESLKYGLETSYETKTEPLAEGPPPSLIEGISRAVSALRLYKAGTVGCSIVLVLGERSFIHFAEGLPNVSLPMLGREYVLTEVEIEEFKKFWSRFKGVDTTKKELKFLEVARRRFNYIYERVKYDDELIDCMVSFESLFLEGGSELGYRMSLRTAVMLAEKSNERKGIFLDMKTAYKLRSMIVHGEDSKKIGEVVEERFGSFKKLSAKMEDYLRRSIRAFYEKASKEDLVKKWKNETLRNLDEGVFDKNY